MLCDCVAAWQGLAEAEKANDKIDAVATFMENAAKECDIKDDQETNFKFGDWQGENKEQFRQLTEIVSPEVHKEQFYLFVWRAMKFNLKWITYDVHRKSKNEEPFVEA